MKLKFGTGGLRATMAPGPDHLNIETIQEATLGVAAYANTMREVPRIAIAYDSRKNSEGFAREAARVLALRGSRVFIYPRLMPTPALSFAVRHLKCELGIAITASHNPKDYNGYKVYGADGGQITMEAAAKIQKEIEKADIEEIRRGESFEELLAEGKITYIEESTKQAFLTEIRKLRTRETLNADLKVVYTPLHGAGAECVTEMLCSMGVDVFSVPEQMTPDGEFPTCPYPNPEENDALKLGLSYCRQRNADILIATDPDSDRVGVAAKRGEAYQRLTGNQVGILLLDYLLKWHEKNGTLPKDPVVVKTIVTSSMAEKIAQRYGISVINTLTGFKYIGEQIGYLEQAGELDRFVFGFEESCGYLIGPYVRDKDAVGAAMLVCEMADAYKAQGKTLWDVLEELYGVYGRHETTLETYAFEADQAKKCMEQLRSQLRQGEPLKLGNSRVIRYLDYSEGVDRLPKADVLKLWMADGEEIVVRPSGTEPKIKIYKETVFRA